jgi:hypothetical protein
MGKISQEKFVLENFLKDEPLERVPQHCRLWATAGFTRFSIYSFHWEYTVKDCLSVLWDKNPNGMLLHNLYLPKSQGK